MADERRASLVLVLFSCVLGGASAGLIIPFAYPIVLIATISAVALFGWPISLLIRRGILHSLIHALCMGAAVGALASGLFWLALGWGGSQETIVHQLAFAAMLFLPLGIIPGLAASALGYWVWKSFYRKRNLVTATLLCLSVPHIALLSLGLISLV